MTRFMPTALAPRPALASAEPLAWLRLEVIATQLEIVVQAARELLELVAAG